jgi:hypothetical protein
VLINFCLSYSAIHVHYMVFGEIAVLSFMIDTFRVPGSDIINRHSKVFRVVICAVQWSVIIRTNQINLQTLLHFNIGTGVKLSYCHVRFKHVAVMSTLTI